MVKKAARARAAARSGACGGSSKKKGGRAPAAAAAAAAAPHQNPAAAAQQLYERAQIALAYGDPDSAVEALREAVRLQPRDPALADAYAALLAETGGGGEGGEGGDDALAALRRAVELSPDRGHEKYLYLAQLLPGGSDEALAAAQKGVALLQAAVDALSAAPRPTERRRKGPGGGGGGGGDDAMEEDGATDDDEEEEDEAEELRAQLSSALCALSEIVCERADMAAAASAAAAGGGGGTKKGKAAAAPAAAASAALPPEVEAEAESLLQRAQALAPHSPEPLQSLAALRYHRQGRADEALALLRRSLALWLPGAAAAAAGQEGGDKAAATEAAAAEAAAAAAAAAAQGGDQDDDDDDDLARLMRATAARQKPRTLSEAGTDGGGGGEGGGGSADGDDDDGEWVTDDGEDDGDAAQPMPAYEVRFEAAKLLLELDDTTDAAVAVLAGLLQEHDSEPDVWHLYALALYSGGAGSADTLREAAEAAGHGRKLLEARRKALRRAGGGGGGEGAEELDAAALAFDDLSGAIAEAQQALAAK